LAAESAKAGEEGNTPSTIGVVIVTFRAGDAIVRALDALDRARSDLPAVAAKPDVVVVDNASRDDTVERIRREAPWVRIVVSPRNVGFAAACNLGVAQIESADLIVLLNPDVEVRRDFLVRLSTLAWPAGVAARGPAVFDEHGRVEQSARGFPRARTGLLGRSSLLARLRPRSTLLRADLRADPHGGPQVVDWVSGACLIAPMARLREVGPLDEGYFMYWEDADWCLRANRLGYQVLYEPSLVVTHRQGSSSAQRPVATTIAFHRSAFRYWRLNLARSPISLMLGGAALSVRCAVKLTAQATRRAGSAIRQRRASR
jgi:N-acetylglucosaminyl-diphospho-decaprenol L-rhamnosyltransferase